MKTETTYKVACFHCGENCTSDKIHLQEKIFCCDGCKMVYELLNENNLCIYYDLNKNPGLSAKIKVREDKFTFLDDQEVQQKLISFKDAQVTHVTFYLPQMHCSSCLWLLENIHKVNPGIISSKVNFTQKEAFLIFSNQETTLRKVVETLTSIGYEPHISLSEIDSGKINKVNKTRLYQLGVAGFCFANIMMMSFPEYFSLNSYIEPNIRQTLSYFIVILSLPVFFYAASEFFVTAWKGLKNKYLNIDAPIALAILMTFVRSLYEIYSHTGSGYLDSMSGIVFFMLLGRILQDKTYRSISFDRDYKSFFPVAVNVIKDEKIIPVTLDKVKVNDLVKIYNNELIPVDGILSKGKAEIDYSFVSGESIPVIKEVGEIIYAGGKQTGSMLELIVTKEVSQSYLTNLWNKDVFKYKAKEDTSFIHVLGKHFTLVVLVLATVAAMYWAYQGKYITMLNTITTVLIVACPCALLLSATFTNGNILRILSRNKLYLRHPVVIEDMAKVDHIVFDKTGTLTQQSNNKVEYHGVAMNVETKQCVASLLIQSSHPLSKMILDYLGDPATIDITDFKAIHGKGIEGWINEKHYKIGSYEYVFGNKNKQEQYTTVYVTADAQEIGMFRIVNNYRFGFVQLMQKLMPEFSLSILSGDNNAEKKYLKTILKEDAEMLFQQKPEEKLSYIEHLQAVSHRNVMMIGDGLNDAGALKQSNVGIAISENVNNFTPACDGILDAAQFSNIDKFIRFAHAGKNIILASFALSIVYNIIGLYYAIQGKLSPLVAAILMPSSSISIILITYGLSWIVAWKIGLLKHDKNHNAQ